MILFYKKDTGEIFATVDGRVHSKKQMECFISDGTPKENIGSFIIGLEESEEIEEYETEVDGFQELPNGLFKKIKMIEKNKRKKRIPHNLDKFEILQRFEDYTPENPMDYKIENNNLIKK